MMLRVAIDGKVAPRLVLHHSRVAEQSIWFFKPQAILSLLEFRFFHHTRCASIGISAQLRRFGSRGHRRDRCRRRDVTVTASRRRDGSGIVNIGACLSIEQCSCIAVEGAPIIITLAVDKYVNFAALVFIVRLLSSLWRSINTLNFIALLLTVRPLSLLWRSKHLLM